MLETLYPGRIDLGIGRAPGSDQLTAVALQHGPGALGIEHFPNQIADLIGFLEHTIPADHPFSRIKLIARRRDAAGNLDPRVERPERDLRRLFRPCLFVRAVHHRRGRAGDHGIVPAPVPPVAAPRRAAGEHRRLRHLRPKRGRGEIPRRQPRPVAAAPAPGHPDAVPAARGRARPTPTTTPNGGWSNTTAAARSSATRRKVKEKLEAMAAEYGVEEIVVLTITHDFAARKRSYALLAETFRL